MSRTLFSLQCESFAITRDHLDDVRISPQNVKVLRKEGYTVPFKLYDDDGILYYSGLLHPENAERIHEFEYEFAPLNWAMADSGCTEIKYKNKDTGAWETL